MIVQFILKKKDIYYIFKMNNLNIFYDGQNKIKVRQTISPFISLKNFVVKTDIQ